MSIFTYEDDLDKSCLNGLGFINCRGGKVYGKIIKNKYVTFFIRVNFSNKKCYISVEYNRWLVPNKYIEYDLKTNGDFQYIYNTLLTDPYNILKDDEKR